MSGGRFDAWFQSDAGAGLDDPASLGPLARAAGLSGFALADAGTTAGLAPAAAGAAAAGVAFLPAVAVEAEAGRGAVTLVGYGIDPGAPPLEEALEAAAAAERRREAAVAAALAAAGVRLPDGQPLTPAALVAGGYAPSRHAARRRYFAPGGLAYTAPELPPAAEVIATLRAAGGRVALRPGPGLADAAAREAFEHAVARLRDAGLAALLTTIPQERSALATLADRLGLAVAGGSGYRGAGRGPEPGEVSSGRPVWAALGGPKIKSS